MAKLNIGAKQAKRLCQKSPADRLSFIAEGLPIILSSARSFWAAAEKLSESPREAEVLEGFAEEEAAKVLILIDIVRCPTRLISDRLPRLVTYFYNHLARCLYAEAQRWKPMDVAQLQSYLDNERKAHYLEGYAGEYILPNSTIARREGVLYADIQAYENDELVWSDPQGMSFTFGELKPTALAIAESLEALGVFTLRGLQVLGEIWGCYEFKSKETCHDNWRIYGLHIDRIIEENLALENSTQDDVDRLYNNWQLPMYNLDFKETDVSLEELHAERRTLFDSEFGFSSY